MVRPLEALDRRHAAPPSPLGSRSSTGSSHQSARGAVAQRRGRDLAVTPLVPKTAEDDRERERHPHRQRERQHEQGDVENEFVHQFVVVARRSAGRPSNEGSARYGPRRHNLASDVRVDPRHPGPTRVAERLRPAGAAGPEKPDADERT